jgi:hypothetical protein
MALSFVGFTPTRGVGELLRLEAADALLARARDRLEELMRRHAERRKRPRGACCGCVAHQLFQHVGRSNVGRLLCCFTSERSQSTGVALWPL